MGDATVDSPKAVGSAYPWWLVLLEGLAAIGVGIFLFIYPAKTTIFLVQVLGWYWIITGVITLVMMFVHRSDWGWKLFSGLLSILAGGVIVAYPLYSSVLVPAVFAIVIGLWGVVIGIVDIVKAFKGAGWGVGLLGVLSIILGIWILTNLVAATVAFPWALGIILVGIGIATAVMSFRLKSA